MPPALTVITVPCFNEGRRLRPDGFRPLLDDPRVEVQFVDDGSTDDTRDVAGGIAGARVLALPRNGGKGEAVRQGMLASLAGGAGAVGYLDADLSTPAEEMLRLVDRLEAPDRPWAVLGSRVALLGADIRRDPVRHYLGRVFATLASAALRAPVYDTQCGAKLFRATDALERALAAPFRSRWAFDVELLGRLMTELGSPDGIVEVPLRAWHDVAGSKLSARAMARSALDLALVARDLRRR